MPRVSVVIPFYNGERFLEAAVNSVVTQHFSDWELLLVNDGSTDGSARIAQRFVSSDPQRIRYLEHEGRTNRGTCASRNLGVAGASGDLVAFLDADDVWLPAKLQEQVRIMDADPAVDMVFGTPLYRHVPADAGPVIEEVPSHGVELESVHLPGTLALRLHPLGVGAGPCPSDILMRRRAVLAVGGFEEAFRGDLQFFEDQAFFAKVFMHLTCYASAATWIHYRVHPGSISTRVRAAGRDVEVRLYFLNWLENHLWNAPAGDAIRAAVAAAQVTWRRLLPEAAVTLRCDGGAVAQLWCGNDPDQGMCIDVIGASVHQPAHDVQVNIPAMEVREGVRYRIALEARASRPCTLPIGVARSGGDWSTLGLYEHLSIDAHWARHDLEFIASAGATRSRIHLDSCQLPVRIEIRRVCIARADAARPDQLSIHAVGVREQGSWGDTNGNDLTRS